MMDNLKEELKSTKTFKQKAVETISDLLVGSANGSKGVCLALVIAEPTYPISMIKEDIDN